MFLNTYNVPVKAFGEGGKEQALGNSWVIPYAYPCGRTCKNQEAHRMHVQK